MLKKSITLTLALVLSAPAWAFNSPRSWERLDGGVPSTTRLREAIKKCELDDIARRIRNHRVMVDMEPIEACMAYYGFRLKRS